MININGVYNKNDSNTIYKNDIEHARKQDCW